MSNKYTYSVPFTEKELYRDYVELRMSQDEIAAKYGTTQKVVWRAMKKMGVPTRVAAKRNQSGELNSFWKGGRVLMAVKGKESGKKIAFGNGYYYILDPSHPNSNKGGYVAEHILVATMERGRPLENGEHVHHINLNKHDNRPENLIICTRTEHGSFHANLQKVAADLLSEGIIAFDAKRGYYRTGG